MTNRQEQTYSMYQVLNQTCQRYAGMVTWQDHKGFADTFAAFLARMAAIRRLRLLQAQETSGITQDKTALRRELCEATLFIADATVVFATSQNDHELTAKAHVTSSHLLYGKQEDAVTTAQNVHDVAVIAPLALALSPFGVTTEQLAELQEKIDDFADAIPKPRTTIKSKKSVTQQLAEEFRAADSLLTEGLDRLIGQFKKARPEFVMDYENARVKVAKAAMFDTAEADTQPTVVVQPKAA